MTITPPAPGTDISDLTRTVDHEDTKTLAIWCARSDRAYNVGAWQTALLLRPKSFRAQVAAHLAGMDLPADHPAVEQWSIGLNVEVSA